MGTEKITYILYYFLALLGIALPFATAMKTFEEALKKGFEKVFFQGTYSEACDRGDFSKPDYWSFRFGDNKEYQLCFEPLLFEKQYYIALYKNEELLTEKVVIKPGYEKHE